MAVKILRRSDEVGLGDFRTELNVLQKVSETLPAQVCRVMAKFVGQSWIGRKFG